jgi:hypothetical protein
MASKRSGVLDRCPGQFTVSPLLADLTMHRCPPLTHVVCVYSQSIAHGRILSRLRASGKDGVIQYDAHDTSARLERQCAVRPPTQAETVWPTSACRNVGTARRAAMNGGQGQLARGARSGPKRNRHFGSRLQEWVGRDAGASTRPLKNVMRVTNCDLAPLLNRPRNSDRAPVDISVDILFESTTYWVCLII